MSIIRDFVELVRNLTSNLNLKVDKSSVTSGNTASTVVSRDGSGNFSAGTITANLTGTASNASKLNNQIFNWSGQAGQPTWVYGGSDGTNLYVYNPSNFVVYRANDLGNHQWGGFAANDIIRLSTGHILQWFRVSIGGDTNALVTFPTAFPNACIGGQVSHGEQGNTSTDALASIHSWDRTQCWVQNGNNVTRVMNVFVIGY